MKLLLQLVFAASITLSLTTIDAKSASAELINYAFTIDSPINTGKGFFALMIQLSVITTFQKC
ncbi:hypothetical protein [Nostoc sp.]|uniref:hypothetical protein n=1 Tax=Nostoc sp. TaxID=1180 RepID=UPI002FF5CE64